MSVKRLDVVDCSNCNELSMEKYAHHSVDHECQCLVQYSVMDKQIQVVVPLQYSVDLWLVTRLEVYLMPRFIHSLYRLSVRWGQQSTRPEREQLTFVWYGCFCYFARIYIRLMTIDLDK